MSARLLVRSYLDLGFERRFATRDDSAVLGGLSERSSRGRWMTWEITAWVLLSLGVFARQGLELEPLSWNLEALRWGSLTASAVVALAVFPGIMRWVNKKDPPRGLASVALPFSAGFFLDLAVVAAIQLPDSLVGF